MFFCHLKIMRTNKTLLEKQIEVYLEWSRRNNVASSSYREWLDLFVLRSEKRDILDVTSSEVEIFLNENQDVIKTQFSRHTARKALTGLLRFYMARSKNGRGKLKIGRPPHLDEIAEVQRYRKMKDAKGNPLSFRAIVKIMEKPIGLVHKWSKYPLDNEGE